jgi:hypothetical protein
LLAHLRVDDPERAALQSRAAAYSRDCGCAGVDAALFMTEAKLKILHGIDLKRFNRADNPDKSSRLRTRAKSSS